MTLDALSDGYLQAALLLRHRLSALRRALRDIRDRGRTLESVITQYLTTVKPMHEQYVEPSRKYADIIVLEGGHNLVALDMIMQRIASHIASED